MDNRSELDVLLLFTEVSLLLMQSDPPFPPSFPHSSVLPVCVCDLFYGDGSKGKERERDEREPRDSRFISVQ